MYVDSPHRDESLLRAHVSSLVMCPKIRSLQLSGKACSLSVLEPLLKSIGPSLLSLTVLYSTPWQMTDLSLILARLPSCMDLRLGALPYRFNYEEPGSILPLKELMQPAHWPPNIQILTLDIIKGKGSIRHVADVISSGALPLLRELYLNTMKLDTKEDASYLGRALMKSGGKLETLHLLRVAWRPPCVDIVSHMLGLHMEDALNESFGKLKVLQIEECWMDWVLLGTAILAGRFPQLREIR